MKQLPSDNSNSSEQINVETPDAKFILHSSTVVRAVFVALAVIFAFAGVLSVLYWLHNLLLVVVFAVFFAYLVAPLVELVQSPFSHRNHARWMPRSLAIGIVYVGIGVALWIAIAYLIPVISAQVSELSTQIPAYTAQVRLQLEEFERRYERSTMPEALKKQIEETLTEFGANVGGFATESISAIALGLFTALPLVILIPILGFFFLKDADLFRLAAVRAFPRGQLRGRAELFLMDVNKTLRAYTRAQLLSCLLIGVICTAGFYFFGVKYALLLGLLAGILEFIPLVGMLIVAILAVTIASFYSFNQAVSVGIFLLVLRLIHDYVTYPRIIREGIHLHPLAIILAILAGGELAGVTGIFLAIPVVAVATVTYRHLMEHSGSAGIVAELLDAGETDKAIDVAEVQLDAIDEKAKEDKEAEIIESNVKEKV